jgi:MFS family permease
MATTTSIELEGPKVSPETPQDPASPDNFGPGEDTVIAESQLADSTAPDGGYGWVIVFACALLTWWFVGTTYCWGVIQGALVEQKLSSASTLSWIGSLAVALNAILAIVSARVIRRIGARWTAVLGILFLSSGEILAGFATRSVGALFLTEGITLGVGVSLCFMAVSTVTAQWFYRKRGLANGIVFAGGGLGGAVISFAMDGLISRLGPAWTFRVIGLLQLATGLPAAWLIKERSPVQRRHFIDWRLFRDPNFAILFLAGAIGTFPLFVPPFFLPLYSHTIGLSTSTGAGLVAGFNFASAVGRVASGFMADKIGPLNSLFIGLSLSAVSMLALWPVSKTLGPLITFVVINGAANGSFFATMPTVVGNMFGSARVAVAMGMIVTSWAGGYLMGAPIAGYLLDAYGGAEAGLQAYRPAIFYAGSLAVCAASLVALIRLRKDLRIFAKW